jgi:hypothetical protein
MLAELVKKYGEKSAHLRNKGNQQQRSQRFIRYTLEFVDTRQKSKEQRKIKA